MCVWWNCGGGGGVLKILEKTERHIVQILINLFLDVEMRFSSSKLLSLLTVGYGFLAVLKVLSGARLLKFKNIEEAVAF